VQHKGQKKSAKILVQSALNGQKQVCVFRASFLRCAEITFIRISPPLTPKGTGRYQAIIRGHIQQAGSRGTKSEADGVSVPLFDFYPGFAFLREIKCWLKLQFIGMWWATHLILFEDILAAFLLGLKDGPLALLYLVALLCVPDADLLDASPPLLLLLFAIPLGGLRLGAQLLDLPVALLILSIAGIFQLLLAVFGR